MSLVDVAGQGVKYVVLTSSWAAPWRPRRRFVRGPGQNAMAGYDDACDARHGQLTAGVNQLCSRTAGPSIAWYPGRRDALGPGPSRPSYSARIPLGGFNAEGVLSYYTNMGLTVRCAWACSPCPCWHGCTCAACTAADCLPPDVAGQNRAAQPQLSHANLIDPSLASHPHPWLPIREMVALNGGGHSMGG